MVFRGGQRRKVSLEVKVESLNVGIMGVKGESWLIYCKGDKEGVYLCGGDQVEEK